MYASKHLVAVVVLLGLALLFATTYRGEKKPVNASRYSNSTEVAVVVVR